MPNQTADKKVDDIPKNADDAASGTEHLGTRMIQDKQLINDNTSMPNMPVNRSESRDDENKSEGEYDTGLNEPVPQGEPTANIGKL